MATLTTAPIEPHHEHNGALWRPVPEATSSFAELLYAQERWMEIFNETDWNPWREDELAPELARVEQVLREWRRAEPDHRSLTKRQVAALSARITRQVKAKRAADEAR